MAHLLDVLDHPSNHGERFGGVGLAHVDTLRGSVAMCRTRYPCRPTLVLRFLAMGVRLKRIRGNEARVPRTDPGEATVIERYGKERAIVLHPDDFHRLLELERLAEDAATLEPLALSEEAIRAHREEGTPGEPVTDPSVIKALFG